MSDAHAEAMHPHDAHHVNYFGVFVALLVCTALSVVFDLVPLNGYVVTFLVLAVATAQALFVMTYFMHLKFEGGWKFVILLPTAILAVGLMVALTPDIGLHYYTYDVPQVREYDEAHGIRFGEPHAEAEHAHDGHSAAPADKAGH
jgi:cytochrome c oxidase subunit 4